jgi:hypothetical protein
LDTFEVIGLSACFDRKKIIEFSHSLIISWKLSEGDGFMLGRTPRIGAVVISSALAASTSAAEIFSDNFNSGPSPLWSNERGNWSAFGGIYNAGSPNYTPPLTLLKISSEPQYQLSAPA